ncbi:hypothetical protein, partial [Aeromonas hydrophila]|uniref:hypothetical protein n=1 Tax=Aeromonas hydrophila TaxID=644 RepID=UPI0035B8D1AF
NDWAFFCFRYSHHFPRIAFSPSRDSVKHTKPDGGHVGMGPFHPVFLAGGNIDVIAMSQLYI